MGAALGHSLSPHRLTVSVLPERLAICRCEPNEPPPFWAQGSFVAVTRTTEELSVVCSQQGVPEHVTCSRGWHALRLEGPFDLALTGVLLSVLQPLAAAGVAIFAVSTYDTDYVLVSDKDLSRAVEALEGAGHHVIPTGT